jgi:hypothetical protein
MRAPSTSVLFIVQAGGCVLARYRNNARLFFLPRVSSIFCTNEETSSWNSVGSGKAILYAFSLCWQICQFPESGKSPLCVLWESAHGCLRPQMVFDQNPCPQTLSVRSRLYFLAQSIESPVLVECDEMPMAGLAVQVLAR